MRFLYSLVAVFITAVSTLFAQSYPATFGTSSNSPVCEGQSFRINAVYSVPPAGTSVSFRWAGPNSYTSTSYATIDVPASTVTAGVYSVTMTFSGTNQGTATTSTTVSLGTSKPMALVYQGAFRFPDRPICGPTSLSLVAYPDQTYSNNTASYRWTGPNGFSSTEQNPVVAQGVAGFYILEATYPNNCGISKDTVWIYNTTLSVATNSYSTGSNPQSVNSFCLGTSAELRASTSPPIGTTVTYQWTGPNGFTSTAQSFTLANLTTAMAGSYTVTATFSGSCPGTATASQSIYVNQLTVFTGLFRLNNDGSRTATQSICPGGDFVVSATAGGNPTGTTFRWTGPNGFSSSVDSPTLTNATTAMSGLYSITATLTDGCSGTGTVGVTIGSPSLFITSASVGSTAVSSNVFCTGTAFRMSVFTSLDGLPITYLWSGPKGFTSTAQSFTLTNADPTMTGAYSVTATFSGGCSGTATASRTIQVGQPSVIIDANPYACPGGPLLLGALPLVNYTGLGGTATYRWTGPNSFTSSAKSFTLTNATSAMTGIYSVTATLSGVCTGTVTTSSQILVTNPSIGLFSDATDGTSGGDRYCEGTSFDIYPIFFKASSGFPSNRSALTYQWSGPNSFTSSLPQPVIPAATTLASGIYSLTATVTGECSGTYTSSIEINVGKPKSTISAFPLAGFAQPNEVYCPGASILLAAYNTPSSASVVSYQWSGPNGFSSSAQSLTFTNVSPALNGIYSLTTVYSGQCASTRVSFRSITVDTPDMYIGVYRLDGGGGGNPPLCIGNYYQLRPNAIYYNANGLLTDNMYEWTLPDGTTTTSPSLTINSASLANAGRYILKTTFGGVCLGGTTRDTTDIKVGISPPGIWASNTFISSGRSTTLYAEKCIGSTIQWSDGQTGSSIIVSPIQTTTYTAVCVGYEGCLSPASTPLIIQVSNQPEADLSLQLAISNRTPALGQPVTVTLSISNSSTQDAHNVRVESRLPGLLSVANAGSMQVEGTVLSTTVGSIGANSTADITFQVAPTTAGTAWLSAQIMATDNPDPDSWPASGTNDGQDDTGWVDLRTSPPGSVVSISPELNPAYVPMVNFNEVFLPDELVDLSLSMLVSNAAPALNEIVTVTLLVNNYDDRRLLSPEVTCMLPAGLTFVSGSNMVVAGQQVVLKGGEYYRKWPQSFSFQARVTGLISEPIKARISHCDWDDVDSDPTNGFDTGEDDTTQVSLRVR